MSQQLTQVAENLGDVIFEFEKVAPALRAQKELLIKYPIFLRAARYPDLYPCNLAHWGMQCGPGWYAMLDEEINKIEMELCVLLQSLSDIESLVRIEWRLQRQYSETTETWTRNPLTRIDGLIPFCSEISINDIGELILLSSGGYSCDGQMWSRIKKSMTIARTKANKICERCGEKNASGNDYWSRIYCERCSS